MHLTVAFVAIAAGVLTAPLSAQDVARPAPTEPRVYNFSASHAGRKLFDGVVTAYRDSMIVTSKSGHCVPIESTPEQATLARFRCSGVTDVDDLTLSFERASPDHATWSGTPARLAKVMIVCTGPVGKQVPKGCTPQSEMPIGPATDKPIFVTAKLKVSAKK